MILLNFANFGFTCTADILNVNASWVKPTIGWWVDRAGHIAFQNDAFSFQRWIRLVHQILDELVECGLVSNMRPDEYEESIYKPVSDIGAWTIKYITDALEKRGVNQLPVAQTQELKTLSQKLREIGEIIEKSPANKLLKDI
jgi:hypothetical protein